MSNEWKELKIDNLPSDILTGDYEWESNTHQNGRVKDHGDGRGIILAILNGNTSTFYYRKPEPKAPTHEARMSLFWKTDSGAWLKPVGYQGGYYLLANSTFSTSVTNQPASWFTGRESAICPPEAI